MLSRTGAGAVVKAASLESRRSRRSPFPVLVIQNRSRAESSLRASFCRDIAMIVQKATWNYIHSLTLALNLI